MPRHLPTPEAAAGKWSRRLKGATQEIREGIDAVDVAPTEMALKKIDKMKTRLLEAFDSGKVARGLKRVGLEEWKRAARDKGVGRIAAGVDEAGPKMEQFMGELLPHIGRGQAEIEKLPDLTLEDSINRVGTFIRHMAGFQRRGS